MEMTDIIYIPSWLIGMISGMIFFVSVIIMYADDKENPFHHTPIEIISFLGAVLSFIGMVVGFYPYLKMIQVIP